MLKKSLKRKKGRRDVRPWALGTFLFLCFFGRSAFIPSAHAVDADKMEPRPAVEQGDETVTGPDPLAAVQPYESTAGRYPDPFVPFVTEETVKAETGKDKLPGLRRFEPGQLSLVGIVFFGKEAIAIVQDPVGKGYPVRAGTKIGHAGVVEEIVPNKVIIREMSYTMAGEQRFTNMEMVLQKKGEK